MLNSFSSLKINNYFKIYIKSVFFVFTIIIISNCGTKPVMSKAGIMTHPRCAKYSSEAAVATCESGLGRTSSPRFSFGLGFSKSL